MYRVTVIEILSWSWGLFTYPIFDKKDNLPMIFVQGLYDITKISLFSKSKSSRSNLKTVLSSQYAFYKLITKLKQIFLSTHLFCSPSQPTNQPCLI